MGTFYDTEAGDGHEGHVAKVFADGKVGVWSNDKGYGMSHRPDAEVRPFADVKAWQVRCECGWTAPVRWLEFEADKDIDRKYAEPTEAREDELLEEWRAHMGPILALDVIDDLDNQVRDLQAQIEEQVRIARSGDVSWTLIGDALGVTRQAAQQRYGG